MTPTNPTAARRLAQFIRRLRGEPRRDVTKPGELVLMREARVQEQIERHKRHREKRRVEKRYNASVEEPTIFEVSQRQGDLF